MALVILILRKNVIANGKNPNIYTEPLIMYDSLFTRPPDISTTKNKGKRLGSQTGPPSPYY